MAVPTAGGVQSNGSATSATVASELTEAQERVLDVVRGAEEQLVPRDIFEQLASEGFSEPDVRAAFWSLIDLSRLSVNRDWKLRTSTD